MGQEQASSAANRQGHNYLWATILIGAFSVWLSYGVSLTSAFLVAYALVCCIAYPMLKPQYRPMGCTGLVILGLLFLFAIPNVGPHIRFKARNAEVKQNLHAIQLALERYARDYGSYPESIGQLMDAEEEYMPRLPRNPFWHWKRIEEGTDERELTGMRPLNEVGWPEDADQVAGDFVYFPKSVLIDGELRVTSYGLMAFGMVSQRRVREVLFPVTAATPVLYLSREDALNDEYFKSALELE